MASDTGWRISESGARTLSLGRWQALLLMAALWLHASAAGAAAVRFVTPRDGAQTPGLSPLEIATEISDIDRVEFFVDGVLVAVVRQPPWRAAFDFGASLQSHSVTAHVWSRHFRQDDVAEVRTAALGESITVNLVEVPLQIRAAARVSTSDLKVVEDGVPQTIRDVIPDRPPARFVFVIDRSQSMDGGKLTAALRAVDSGLELLRPGDTAQIIFFNHNLGRLQDLPRTARPSSLFADVLPSGGTSLRDAVVSTVARGRTNAIVITDGADRNSETSEAEALRRISRTNAVFYALVFDSASRFLEAASRNTGGDLIKVTTTTAQTGMRDLLFDINSRYTLTYQSSGASTGWREIHIASRRAGVKVLKARRGYFAE